MTAFGGVGQTNPLFNPSGQNSNTPQMGSNTPQGFNSPQMGSNTPQGFNSPSPYYPYTNPNPNPTGLPFGPLTSNGSQIGNLASMLNKPNPALVNTAGNGQNNSLGNDTGLGLGLGPTGGNSTPPTQDSQNPVGDTSNQRLISAPDNDVQANQYNVPMNFGNPYHMPVALPNGNQFPMTYGMLGAIPPTPTGTMLG